MGGNVSKSDVENFKENIIDASIEILQKTLNYNVNEALSQANQTVTIEGSTISCPQFSIIQNMEFENRVYNKIDDEQESEINQQLNAQMQDILKRTVEQSQSGIVLGNINKSEAHRKFVSKVFLDLSSEISKETQNVFNNRVEAVAEQDIKIVDSTISCIPSNNPLQEEGLYIRQSVGLTNVMDSVVNSKKVNNIINKAIVEHDFTDESADKQTQEGLDPFAIFALIAAAMVFGILLLLFIGSFILGKGVLGGGSGSGKSKSIIWTILWWFFLLALFFTSIMLMGAFFNRVTGDEPERLKEDEGDNYVRNNLIYLFSGVILFFLSVYLIYRNIRGSKKKSTKKEEETIVETIEAAFGLKRKKNRRKRKRRYSN